jgi:hypothetical protein
MRSSPNDKEDGNALLYVELPIYSLQPFTAQRVQREYRQDGYCLDEIKLWVILTLPQAVHDTALEIVSVTFIRIADSYPKWKAHRT